MKSLLGAFLISMTAISPEASAQQKSAEPCPSNEILAKELLEYEISGVRVDGTKADCADRSKFPNTKPEPPILGEKGHAEKPLLVNEKNPFTIRATRELKSGRVEVELGWNQADSKKAPVLDRMTMNRYDGDNRKYFGCAVLSQRPSAAAVRPSCLKK